MTHARYTAIGFGLGAVAGGTVIALYYRSFNRKQVVSTAVPAEPKLAVQPQTWTPPGKTKEIMRYGFPGWYLVRFIFTCVLTI